jgi:Zn finger protein HypA/HybF involved in hydrogenase expression
MAKQAPPPGQPELHCNDCSWEGMKKGTMYYHNQHAYECPVCGSDAIAYSEWLTDKAQER